MLKYGWDARTCWGPDKWLPLARCRISRAGQIRPRRSLSKPNAELCIYKQASLQAEIEVIPDQPLLHATVPIQAVAAKLLPISLISVAFGSDFVLTRFTKKNVFVLVRWVKPASAR